MWFLRTSLMIVAALATPRTALAGSALDHAKNYTLRVADQSRGLLTISFDSSAAPDRSLQIISQNDAGFHPNWLFAYRDKIYSISRSKYPNNESINGGLFEFTKYGDGYSGPDSLDETGSVSSDGFGGVYVGVSKDGRTLSAANIDGSTVSIHPLSPSGKIANASYVFKYHLEHPGPGTGDSQIMSNPHEAIFEPSGRYMFVPDRGADRLYVYDVVGPFNVSLAHNITLPLGTGPRHMTFRPYNETRTFAYLVSELDNTVRVFALDNVQNEGFDQRGYPPGKNPGQKLIIELIQVASTLYPGSDMRTAPIDQHMAAEVALSNDGKYAYASNRDTTSLDPDTITIFSVQTASNHSHLTWVGQSSTHGKIPRDFSLSPEEDNKYIAVANEATQSLIVLERDQRTGFANKVVGNLTLGELDPTLANGPICVIWDATWSRSSE